MRLYVGNQANTTQGERQNLGGYRCFTAAYTRGYPETAEAIGLLDSGAFSDPLSKRKTPEAALMRQLKWEESASKKINADWLCQAIASYDLLIDETWTNEGRVKRRWSVEDAETAVKITIDAARYLTSQRQYLQPRHLVLGCQGVDVEQYRRCTEEILGYSEFGDWIGLGGWCILGRMRSLIPTYWEVLHQVIPLIAESAVRHVHLYGSLLDESCATLLWFCDRYDLTCSVDSGRPIADVTRADLKKSGAKFPYWRDNVKWWKDRMASLRSSRFYREPPRLYQQLSLFT